MTRKLKAFGLALVAACALSAALAQAASAEALFHSNAGTTFGTGSQIGTNQLDTTSGNVKCKQVSGGGSMLGNTATTIRIAPTYGECTAFGLVSIIDINGCSYLVTSHGVMHIDCPTTAGGVTDEVTITVLPGSPHGTCVIHIPEQAINASYANDGTTPTRDLTVILNSESIFTYTVTYPTGEAEGKCGKAGHHSDGKYTGTITVKGFLDEAHAVQADLWAE